MSTTTKSLWPEKFMPLPTVAPVTILREQAELLGQSTKNVIEGMVTSDTESNILVITHTLRLRAPVLGIRSDFIKIFHSVTDLYPASICIIEINPFSNELIDHIKNDNKFSKPQIPASIGMYSGGPWIKLINASNNKELEAALSIIFTSSYAQQVLGSLLAQSLDQAA